MKVKFDSDTVQISIDKRIFSNKVIQKCFYWYTADYTVDFETVDEHFVSVTMTNKSQQEIDQVYLAQKIPQDLNDFLLRDMVQEETRDIRALIVAKAFANFEQEEDFPLEQIGDSLGFNTIS